MLPTIKECDSCNHRPGGLGYLEYYCSKCEYLNAVVRDTNITEIFPPVLNDLVKVKRADLKADELKNTLCWNCKYAHATIVDQYNPTLFCEHTNMPCNVDINADCDKFIDELESD